MEEVFDVIITHIILTNNGDMIGKYTVAFHEMAEVTMVGAWHGLTWLLDGSKLEVLQQDGLMGLKETSQYGGLKNVEESKMKS